MDWAREIDELHQFFEDYFHGRTASIDRAGTVLASDFTLVSPDGSVSDRAATLAMLEQAHDQTNDLTITTLGHELIAATTDAVTARYIEAHARATTSNQRLTTVLFRADPAAPNGLLWVTAHETWLTLETKNPAGGE